MDVEPCSPCGVTKLRTGCTYFIRSRNDDLARYPIPLENKLGATESERIARLAVADPTIEVLGVLCIAKDPRAAQRERQTFDDRTVFRMNVQEEDGKIVAHLVSRVEARSIAKK
jgi:hypothetical protein